ncbi:MAG: hypothetical protein BEN18_01740 [Epulopiscium sp. Nuni2H_MBin001]|nr:MAG: hypothetical protein BEN18_01740 [Epulopiscium sp. Nuni2H_MBin001]
MDLDQDEKLFLKMLQDYTKKSRELYSDFYDRDWINGVLNRYVGNNTYPLVGGYDYAQRVMLCVTPYDEPYDIPICILKIEVSTGIGKDLTHRDFLGSLLALGIERTKIGDIIVSPSGAYVIVRRSISEFIRWNLTQVGRYSKLNITEAEHVEVEPPKYKKITGTVASVRADAVFSLAFGISRTTCSALLKQGKGKCSGMVITGTYHLNVGEVASLQGFGKFRLKEVSGVTRKNRLSITLEKFI